MAFPGTILGSLAHMGYKILGFAVWQGGKWYLKHRAGGLKRKAAFAALAGVVVIGGLAVAQRQHAAN
jgi:hypothetical protein